MEFYLLPAFLPNFLSFFSNSVKFNHSRIKMRQKATLPTPGKQKQPEE
jgi:hypothetical protein